MATIETNLQQGYFETGVDTFSSDQASSEWEERQKSRAEEVVTVHDTAKVETEVDGMKGALAETENSTDELRSRSLLRTSPGRATARDVHREGAVAGLRKRKRQHGWTCPQPHGNAVFLCLFWIV